MKDDPRTGKSMNQPNLPFDAPAQRHSATSVAAAQAIEPTAGTLRAEVLKYLRSRSDGATDEEIQQALAMPQNTERPRRIELCRLHLVADSGMTRPTASGRQAVVWKVATK